MLTEDNEKALRADVKANAKVWHPLVPKALATIDSLRARLDEVERETAALRETIKVKDSHIADLAHQLVELRNAVIDELAREAVSLRTRLAAEQANVARLREALEGLVSHSNVSELNLGYGTAALDALENRRTIETDERIQAEQNYAAALHDLAATKRERDDAIARAEQAEAHVKLLREAMEGVAHDPGHDDWANFYRALDATAPEGGSE